MGGEELVGEILVIYHGKLNGKCLEDGRLACGGMMLHVTQRRSLSVRTAPSCLLSRYFLFDLR